jgi:homoserine O-succinyltransferase
MPVLVDHIDREHCLYADAMWAGALPQDRLTIGLVNNMPDGALASTERQVFDLLRAASDELPVSLHLYALPTVVRSEQAREYIRRSYLGIGGLCGGTLDGVIVTGAEPRAPQLTEEAYWSDLRQVIEWAKVGASSAIWSCLAVHAAVRHLDGIERRRLAVKCIGVFEQTRAMANHPLLVGTPSKLRTPHSRWNETPEEPLRSHGYEVLTRSSESGVDTFVKRQSRSLFVFLQGHPEYATGSLLGEYRRDVGRFLRSESDDYPTMPRNYFNKTIERMLREFRERSLQERSADLLSSFPVSQAAVAVENTWRAGAVQLYRNWLKYLWENRANRKKVVSGGRLVMAAGNEPVRSVARVGRQ